MMRLTILISFLLVFLSCKSKYQRAFEELDAREFAFYSWNSEGNWQEVELLTNASIYRPDLIAIIRYRAEEYEKLKEWRKAKEDYNFCIKNGSTYAMIYFQKGICEMNLQNFEKAEEDFKEAEKRWINEWSDLSEEQKSVTHWGDPNERFEETLDSIRSHLKKAQNKEFLFE